MYVHVRASDMVFAFKKYNFHIKIIVNGTY